MSALKSKGLDQREPIAKPAIAVALAEVLIALLLAFGLNLTGEQIAALMSLLVMIGSTVIWFVSRKTAWSPQSVELVTGKGIEELNSLLAIRQRQR